MYDSSHRKESYLALTKQKEGEKTCILSFFLLFDSKSAFKLFYIHVDRGLWT